MKIATLIALFLLSTVFSLGNARAAAERSGALLAFSRQLSGPLVHGLNVTVRYSVHNVGKSPAIRAQLRDSSFPASRFHLYSGPSGALRHTWSSVKAGASDYFEMVVAAKRSGILYVSPPAVTYRDAGQPRVVRLASTDEILVEDLAVYTRRTKSHKQEWLAYLAAVAALVVMPGLVYSMRMPQPDSALQPKKQN